ncbi:MAG: LLM class flavin-dependent oxidoreductase [Microbacteriaceae bacterium]|jgi:alkanesulfonate monooxygenase SsuD/methylene tetrahydromethanopterin reductase-like flavin-dependent oxidoreductase (luciferase family)|nr:LLM class flavin-dependent oxidoreductase [Microbacteriaceae bacterium]HPZ34453.1 LLM class flavin-dependent oxidoreductase [Microbacteriaceae bacterium]HQC93084.1 LLM class flavin-dependent oxidoreductase [Microbacteriaceae bacterium]
MQRIGSIFTPSFPPEHLKVATLAAEAAGVAELWLWEDCFRESAFAAASAMLAWTQHLRVGIGVAPMPMRNVALTAMEIATVERMFPGRLIPGVGHGVQSWMAQIGARPASPLTLMREYVPALRALLAGHELTTAGRYVTLDRVRLDWPPAAVPAVIAAAEGPRTLRLAGEVADGTLLPAGWSPRRVREARQLIGEGVDASGRAEPHETIVFVVTAFGERAEALARAEAEVSQWVAPEDGLVLAGSPARIADDVEAFFDAGASAVMLQPAAAEPGLEGFMAQVGEVVRLRAAR